MKEKLRLKERRQLNNIKTHISNLKIRTKILVLVVLICFFAMGSLSVISYVSIKNTADYSRDINIVLSKEAVKGTEGVLLEQARQFMISIAREQSGSCDAVMNNIKANVSLIETAVQDLFNNPQYYENSRPIVRPHEAVAGIYENTYTLPEGVPLTTEIQQELSLLSNLSTLMSSLAFSPNISQLYVGMNSGLFYNYTNGTIEIPDFDPRVRPWYVDACSHPEQVIFTDAYEDAFGNGMIISVAKAVFDDNNKLLGVAAMDTKLEVMKQLVLSTRVMDSGYAFILNNTGRYIIHPNLGDEGFDPYPLSGEHGSQISFAEGYQCMMNGEEGFIVGEIAGKRYFLSYSPISITGWSVGVIVPEEEFLASLKKYNSQMAALSSESEENIKMMTARTVIIYAAIFELVVIMVAMLSSGLTHLITEPIQKLAAEVGKISKDNPNYRIPVQSRDEIGVLTESFNKMADNLNDYTQHIIELMHSKTELETAAYTDTLTATFNRRYFMEFAQIQLSAAVKQGSNTSIIMMDIDHFKKVNDTYGHQIGDEVLKQVALRVKATIRAYDLFARYGGEEFILLVTNVDKIVVWNLVERIRMNICKDPIQIDELSIPVCASFGIVHVTQSDALGAEIALADKALYAAKNKGRNQTVVYRSNMG